VSEERGVTTAMSADHGRIPVTVFRQLWCQPGAIRFRYRPIWGAPAALCAVIVALWAYYVDSLVDGPGVDAGLVLFGIGLLALSVWVVLRLFVWRLFVRRSGVVVTDRYLAWRRGAVCLLAPWERIDPDALGIERLAFERRRESALTIRVGDTEEPLTIGRLYARLENLEGFLAELLTRIPRERWRRAPSG